MFSLCGLRKGPPNLRSLGTDGVIRTCVASSTPIKARRGKS